MTKSDLKNLKLPDNPGVYFFLGKNKEILYIGKATSLRNRVRSYFADDIKIKRSELIERMVAESDTVDFTETDSTLEALILEANLIRTHKPRFNTRSKDDKSFNHLIITKEEWPRVLVVRGKDLVETIDPATIKYEFGPFTSGQLFREALKVVRKLFKYYDTKNPIKAETSKLARGKINFNQQIGLYPNEENKEEYQKTIQQIKWFFQGKKKKLLRELHKDMMSYAKREEFELANRVKKKIYALQHIEDTALIRDDTKFETNNGFRIEAYDIAHLQGSAMVGVMTVLTDGRPSKADYRKFNIKTVQKSNDTGALKEVLQRRFRHTDWRLPDLIVIDGAKAQQNVAQSVLKEFALKIPLVCVVKDDKHRPDHFLGSKRLLQANQEAVLLANHEAHRFAISFHRQKRSTSIRQ